MSEKLMIRVKPEYEKWEPDYLKGWREANSQFQVIDNKLFVDYEDDDEPGLHDVSYKYDWKFEE